MDWTKADPKAIELATSDPVECARRIFHVEPHPWQCEALSCLFNEDAKREAERSGRRAGKTMRLALSGLIWLLRWGDVKGLCTAPTQHQLKNLLWPEFRKWIYEAGLQDVLLWSKTHIRHASNPENWFLAAQVSRIHKEGAAGELGGEAHGIRGFHSPHTIILADEASGIPDPAYVAFEGSLSGDHAKLIACSNPTTPQGWYYDAFHRDCASWVNRKISYKESPMVSPEWAESMIQRFGLKNPVVRVHVLGEFPTGIKGGLIELATWEAAQDQERHAEVLATQAVSRRVLGVDVAREGSNRTIISYAVGGAIEKLELVDEYRSTAIAAVVKARRESWESQLIVVDADGGYGAGVVDELIRMGVPGVVAWRGSAAAMESERFYNARAELGWAVKMALEDGTVAVPGPEAQTFGVDCLESFAQAQATGIKYEHKPDGRIGLESKDKMVGRGIQSPDEFDAICYSLVPAVLAPALGGELFLPTTTNRYEGLSEVTNAGRHRGGASRGVDRSIMVS